MNACEKKIKKPIGKTGYPVSGNLRISGRISESGFSKLGYPGIRYPGSKSVSGTTLVHSQSIYVWSAAAPNYVICRVYTIEHKVYTVDH